MSYLDRATDASIRRLIAEARAAAAKECCRIVKRSWAYDPNNSEGRVARKCNACLAAMRATLEPEGDDDAD